MKILKRVIKAVGKEKIRVLLADREFMGGEWFRFLIEQEIPFVIRIKKNSMVEGIRQGYSVPVATLLGKLGRKKVIENYPIVLWKHRLFVSVEHKKGAKEPMIVVSNREFPSPLNLYRWRWGIETLFECLKTRGFRMEETHMTDPRKIEKLLFILAIAVCWAYKIGELQARKVAITIKKHGRKLKSIFRLGLDLIRRVLFREDPDFIEGLTVFPYLGLVGRGPLYEIIFCRVQRLETFEKLHTASINSLSSKHYRPVQIFRRLCRCPAANAVSRSLASTLIFSLIACSIADFIL